MNTLGTSASTGSALGRRGRRRRAMVVMVGSALLVPAVSGSAHAGSDPQDTEIRAAVAQAVAGTELATPDEVLVEVDNYRWIVEFDEFRANRFPDAPDPFHPQPLWSDFASWSEVSIALDGAQMLGDARSAPDLAWGQPTTVCGQPAELNLHPTSDDLQYSGWEPMEVSMGPDHEAEVGTDRPRGPEVYASNGSVYFTLGRFFFRASVGAYDNTQDAAIQQVEQALATLTDGLCAAFTPLVPDVSTTAPPTTPPTTTPSTTPPTTAPPTTPTTAPTTTVAVGGPVTVTATLPGHTTDVETVPNPDGFGSLEVTGRVVALADGSPLAGATVSATTGGSGTTTTAADGSFTLRVTVPGGTPDTGQLDGLLLELAALAGLRVDAVPPLLTTLGESTQVTATLTDDAGVPLPGVVVTLDVDGHPAAATTGTTGADGTVAFTLVHDDPAAASYRVTVATPDGTSAELIVPVGGIVLETDPATGEPYRGIAADAAASVQVEIHLPPEHRIAFVAEPEHGVLTLDGEPLDPSGVVELDQGSATLTYTPPAYLADELLTEQLTVERRRQGVTARVFAARDVLRVGYDDVDGVRREGETSVLLVRPPVMLVHGFTGDESTWANLENYLTPTGFDPVNGDYVTYQGGLENTSIQYQSDKLRFNIAAQREAYADAGLLLRRVDVVAHSMGGLITRHYIEEMASYAGDVRKLIMAGTPNHGAGPVDTKIASLASLVFAGHQVAGQQLYRGSLFLRQLNDGEAVGTHLAPGVQYANLIGRRSTNFAAIFGIPYANDDGVVTTASATLNGVHSWIFDGLKHSGAVALYGDAALTDAYEIFSTIETLLLADIPAGQLAGERMEISASSGEVTVRRPWEQTAAAVTELPYELGRGDQIVTGPDGTAVVELSVGGSHWGTIDVAPRTTVTLAETSPRHVVVRVADGSVRLRSAHPEVGVLDVLVGPDDTDPERWFEAYPFARITDADTDFVVATDPVRAWSLDGSVVVASDVAVELVDVGGVQLEPDGSWATTGAPERWWEDDGDGTGTDEVLGVPTTIVYVVAAIVMLIGLLVLVLAAVTGPHAWAMVVGGLVAVLGAGTALAGFLLPDDEGGTTTLSAPVLPDVTGVALASTGDPPPASTSAPTVPTTSVPTTTATTAPTTTPPTSPPSTSAATTTAPTTAPPPETTQPPVAASCTTAAGLVVRYDPQWFVWDDDDPEFDCSLFDAGPMPTFAEADFAAVILTPEPALGFDEARAMWADPYWTILAEQETTIDGVRAWRAEVATTDDPAAGTTVVWTIDTTPLMTLYAREGGYAGAADAAAFADDLVTASDWTAP